MKDKKFDFDVFKPYAGVSTVDKVWLYDMEADGYSLDDKQNFIGGKGVIYLI